MCYNKEMKDRIYIITKFVVAKSMKDAIEKEKKYQVSECYLEETSRRASFEDMLNKK